MNAHFFPNEFRLRFCMCRHLLKFQIIITCIMQKLKTNDIQQQVPLRLGAPTQNYQILSACTLLKLGMKSCNA